MHLPKLDRFALSLALALQVLWLAGGPRVSAQGKLGRETPAPTPTPMQSPVRRPARTQTRANTRPTSDKPNSTEVELPAESPYVQEGLRYAGEGKWAEAIKAYRHALVDNPQDAAAYLSMGDAYLNAGNDKEALNAYQQAVRLAPRNADAQYSLGAAYNFTERYSDAFKPFVQAVTLDPDYAEAYYGIGYAYQQLDNFKDAVGYLKRALRLKPDYPEAMLALGLSYAGLGDVPAAEAQLKLLQGMDATLARELDREIARVAGTARTAAQANTAARNNQPAPVPRVNTPAPEPKRPTVSTSPPTPTPTATQAANTAAPLAVELSFWDSIKNSSDPAEYNAYLKKYPDGQFAELARIRLHALEGKKNAAGAQTAEQPQEVGIAQPMPTTEQAASNVAPPNSAPPSAASPSSAPASTPVSSASSTDAQPSSVPPVAARPVEPVSPVTLEETVDWIRRYFPTKFTYQATTPGDAPNAPPVTRETNIDYQLLRFDSCQLEWRDGGDTLSVALVELDPLSVKVELRTKPDTTFNAPVWNVSLNATGGKGAFTETKGSGTVNKYNGIDLQYNDQAQADRLARALQHVIKLCGGKSE
ncbi:MAG: tetratricopeptide repeat protein [Pyrinomonadaceae bacterium]